MANILQNLKSGDWVDRERLVFYPLLLLAVTACAVGYVLWLNGGTLPNGSPFGSDFVSFWVAARQALAGQAHLPYDAAAFAAAQDAIFGDGNFYAFFYPPHYLAYMSPFGVLPYYGALASWMALSFAAAAFVVYRITGGGWRALLLVAAFPATFLTLAHGQNAFLSAALFGGALVLIDRRPIAAGVLFGFLTFKPQLGLLIPVALLAGGYGRTIISAAATTVMLAVASALLFGADIWLHFLAQGGGAFEALREGQIGWNKMISPYAMLRLGGLPHGSAMVVQAAVSVAVAAAVAWAWWRSGVVARETRNALLLTGALLATPFGLNYDIFLLAPAIAFIAMRGLRVGFGPYEVTLLAAVYAAPLAMLLLMADGISFAPVLLAILFVQQFATAWRTPAPHGVSAPSPAQ